MLKIIYTLFLGVLLAIFIGVGIATFYESPTAPEPPLTFGREFSELTAEQESAEAAFQQAQKDYDRQFSTYNRNTSLFAFGAAIIVLIISLSFAKKIDVISDGLLLGGVFTLLYSLGRGLAATDNAYRFLIVSLGMLVALSLGYLKFIKPQTKLGKKA